MKAMFGLRWGISTLLILLCMATAIHPDSLWEKAKQPLYGVSKKRIKVGDIITVLVTESTSAVQEAGTSAQKTSKLNTAMVSNWDQVANLLGNETNRKNLNVQLTGGDDYRGTGQTSRRSRVQATITAMVTEILETGNLYIVGEHQVKVNDEIETIRIAGIIRPQDITPQNRIASSQIAKAEISVNGAGVVASKQSPGILTKMLNWLF